MVITVSPNQTTRQDRPTYPIWQVSSDILVREKGFLNLI